MGGAESNPGGAKFDLTRMRTLPAGAGGEVVRSTALPGLPSLCPLVTFNDDEDEDEEASGSGGGTAVMLVVDDISCPTDIPGDAVCARGGGGGGGGRRRRTRVLVLGANMNEGINVTVELDQLGIGIGNGVERVLELGAELEEKEEEEGVGRLVFLPVGSGAWIFSFEG